jgi:hypothetical protein
MNMKTVSVCFSLLATALVARSAQADCSSGSPCTSQSNSGSGVGVYARNTGAGIAVYAESAVSGGVASYARAALANSYALQAVAQTNNSYAGYFTANGSGSIAVYGSSTSATGVYCTSGGGGIPGVHGFGSSASNGIGVKGTSSTTGTAIWGYSPGHQAAWFDGDCAATTFTTTSDERLKKDIRDLTYGTTDLMKLRPVTFKWKSGADGTHLGLIAQEVEKVIPEVVSHSHSPSLDGEVLTVNYNELFPLMLKTVQEQNKTISQQGARIAELEKARGSVKLSSLLVDGGGGLTLGLLPLGLVLASRRRKNPSQSGASE